VAGENPVRRWHVDGSQIIVLLALCVAVSQVQAETAVERGQYLVEVLAACGNCHTPLGPQGPIRALHLAGGAIVAYLRTVPPVHNVVPPGQYTIPLPESYGPPVTSVPEPPREDPIKYGEYLAGPIAHSMPWPYFAGKIAAEDLQALLAYLRSLQPITNKVPPPEGPKN
jgi:hypothetical protein